MKKILIATTNPGKKAELSAMLDMDIEWVSLSDFPKLEEVAEDGNTFAENARKKSLGYAKQTNLWTIADDSGLEVDALGGQPGVKSARFAESYRRERRDLLDKKNIEKVLKLLDGVPREERTARFRCCLCLAAPDEILIETEGKIEGIIAEKEIGAGGFGYDPIFFVPDLNKTVAQISPEQKNSISHRGNAIRKLKPLLSKLLE
ncbi:MAG: XTP/dITP diphosphatase [Sedimentisphaerales bacterium]|nr:XTP/dITP diphosphatase [Sedimentisphaerales bacterium]